MSGDFRLPSPLCAIIDVEIADRDGWSPADLACACLAGGARFLQVRAKREPGSRFLDTASRIVHLARQAHATVVLNDRADIAQTAGADGVHVGQHDLPASAVRMLLGDAAIVGLSTHTRDQIGAALAEPISYLAIGPVFGSTTKATGYDAVGLERVSYAAARARAARRPVVAIGGITLDSAASVIEAGAAAVAVISDLLSTGDPESRVRTYLERLAGVRAA